MEGSNEFIQLLKTIKEQNDGILRLYGPLTVKISHILDRIAVLEGHIVELECKIDQLLPESSESDE